MFIETIKTYACSECDVGVYISECVYDSYEGKFVCPHCNNFAIEVIHERKPHWFSVAIYEVSRSYGGPEEGGWWYDAGDRIDETVRTFPNSPEGIEEAERYLESLHALHFPQRLERWHSTPHTSRVFSEALPDDHFPRHTPIYS